MFKKIIFNENDTEEKSERKINAMQINEANLLVFYEYFHERTWNMASSEIICTISGSAMGISRRGKSVSCLRAMTTLVLYLFLFQELSNIAHTEAPIVAKTKREPCFFFKVYEMYTHSTSTSLLLSISL